MSTTNPLPIKVVFPRKEDYKAPPPPGGSTKVFGIVDDALRASFATEVREVQRHFEAAFTQSKNVPAVAKVTLKPEAVAKSHRPSELFNSDTCPIIGGNKLGELYISVEPKGLDALASKIEQGESQKVEASISTLKAILPFTMEDVLGSTTLAQLQDQVRDSRTPLRVRLFRHASPAKNALIDLTFERVASENGVGQLEALDYADGLRVYCARDVSADKLAILANTIGIQSMSLFPDYKVVRTMSRALGNITPADFPAPDPSINYPLVGIIDTGTDPNNPHLQAWVEERYEHVPRDFQDNDHGSFVAGLVVHGRKLNHNDPRFPSVSSRIIDVVALDRDGRISEDELLIVIDDALKRFPLVKVWNLSLGQATPCTDNAFSEFGAALDERSSRHGVLFVVAAGNYNVSPFRTWPPQPGIDDDDRICPPADAIRAITVGSLAHLDTPNTRVRREEPSPFSRRGPGPAYLIKPELTFYGGNCDATGDYVQSGVVSIDGQGHRAENIGTSFANPLAATLAANVDAELRLKDQDSPRALTKALMIHSAFIQNALPDGDRINYSGLGCPPDISSIINCRQSAATIIMQIPVSTKPVFGKRPFPMPSCLVTPEAGLQGEVFMTLMYEPPLDRNFGVEYCRCNVSASLGTIGHDLKTGKEKYSREVNPVPKQLNSAYEEELVQQGYKWSPLKLYYRKFTNGPVDKPWRLTLDMLNRSDHESDEQQDVVLIITLRGKSDGLLVYDELVREMDRLGWGAIDLQLRSRLRSQS